MASMVEVRVPADQTEGTRSQVLRWLKQVGDAVRQNDPLLELETDKVTVEVASPADGTLAEISRQEPDEVQPGELLGRIAIGQAVAAVAGPVVASAAAATSSKAGSGAHDQSKAAQGASGARGRLSPAVRKLLGEHQIEVAAIQGTGVGGRITHDDVLRHLKERSATPAGDGGGSGIRSHTVPITPMRKRIATHMVESLLHISPHVTSVFECDCTAVLAHRDRYKLQLAEQGIQLTLTAYFVLAAVAAIRAVPQSNSRWRGEQLEIFDDINIGVATALESDGLVVPVLRAAQAMDLADVAHGLNELIGRARSGSLKPAEVRDGTFTISNHGVSGSLIAAPIIINQPQVAILGIGKLSRRPAVVEQAGEERIVARPLCYVTLTIDHRVMDGLQANRFLTVFTQTLETWSV